MRVRGVVRDEETGMAITGASVVIGRRSVNTDALGRYRIGAEWKRTTMTVGAAGYEPLEVAVDGSNRNTVQDVVLRRASWTVQPASRSGAGRDAPVDPGPRDQ